jgi:hypothetical protein
MKRKNTPTIIKVKKFLEKQEKEKIYQPNLNEILKMTVHSG